MDVGFSIGLSLKEWGIFGIGRKTTDLRELCYRYAKRKESWDFVHMDEWKLWVLF